MNCITCGADISRPIQQFGNLKDPMCASCWLDGKGWVYEDFEIVDELRRGMSLSDAMELVRQESVSELELFAMELFGTEESG